MKSQKGVTLTTLVLYIVLFVMVIGIMTTIFHEFMTNLGKVKDYPEYISEFNKFSMFFIADAKKNTDVKSIENGYLEFSDGTTYSYRENCIYRNDTKIVDHIMDFSFQKREHIQNSFTKNIINVSATIGTSENQLVKDIDFVLKYW